MPIHIQSIRFQPLEQDTELQLLFPRFKEAQHRVQLSHDGIQPISYKQLRYLRDYIVGHREFDSHQYGFARSMLIEDHYIDRDYMEDFSSFYARSLDSPGNACSRIHFFSIPSHLLESKLTELREQCRPTPPQPEHQSPHSQIAQFSSAYYLGFAVLRPLPGAPVGRTILRALPEEKRNDPAVRRLMTNVQRYTAHVLGLDLSVHGLPFQQQDICISACATVSIWCALHRAARADDLHLATPAEITHFATQFRLPFGRAVPTPGLDVDQVCMAVQCTGAAPFLTRVTNLQHGRALLYSATLSGLASILIMKRDSAENHAVTVAGMKITNRHQISAIGKGNGKADDLSGDLMAFYVHDDRIGPYRRVEIKDTVQDHLVVKIPKLSHPPPNATREYEEWIVDQVLIPLYPKIRVNFNDMFHCAYDYLVIHANHVLHELGELHVDDPVRVQYRLHRGHDYLAQLNQNAAATPETLRSLHYSLALPRYLATISLMSPRWGRVDVLLDTTSARTNLNWLAIVVMDGASHIPMVMAHEFQHLLNCRVYGDD